MDGGAWWAAVRGVAKSRIRLKQQQQQQPEGKLALGPAFIAGLKFSGIGRNCW